MMRAQVPAERCNHVPGNTLSTPPPRARRATCLIAAGALVGGSLLIAPAATAAPDDGPETLGLTGADVMTHLTELAEITESYADRDYRAFYAPGYTAAAEYAEQVLADTGAFTITRQEFEQPYSTFGDVRLTVDGTAYEGSHFDLSEGTDAPYTAPLAQPTADDEGLRLGCAADDFAEVPDGAIVLVQRGVCTFEEKIGFASGAGAGAVFVYNNARPVEEGVGPDDQLTNVGSGDRNEANAPAATLPQASGEILAALIDAAPEDAPVEGTAEIVKEFLVGKTFNVIADSIAGDPEDTIVIGAHLDGVPEGPGVNDNASGSAAILALAEKIAASDVPNDKRIRLALWSAEEVGLVGSTHYVDDLVANDPAELARISAYLNYDMIGSENFTVGVYDANRSTYPAPDVDIPAGSAELEKVYSDYFDGVDQPWVDSEYSGRSDYQAFIDNGIPAGGLFSGADDLKTPEQAALFGGEAGVIMDRNYHTADDTLANVSRESIDIFAPAIGNATAVLAWNAVEPSPEPTDPGAEPSPEPSVSTSPSPTATTAPAGTSGPRGSLANTGSEVEGSPLALIGVGMLAVGVVIAVGTIVHRRRAQSDDVA